MPSKNDDNKKALTLSGAIALGALIAYNLPTSKSKADPSHSEHKPKRKPEPRNRTYSPPPPWRKYPPLDHPHYRQERYYLRYKDSEDQLCVVDQRPAGGTVQGPERRSHDVQEGGFEVERYYHVNGSEAGPDEAHRIVKRGYPKWDR